MDPEDILKGRFVSRVLSETATAMDKDIDKVISSNAFKNSKWGDRSFSTSSSALIYTHLKRHRFVNMKRIKRNNKEIKKHPYPIHNQIIYGHYGSIIRQLKYGFTEAIKLELMSIKE